MRLKYAEYCLKCDKYRINQILSLSPRSTNKGRPTTISLLDIELIQIEKLVCESKDKHLIENILTAHYVFFDKLALESSAKNLSYE